MAEPTVEMSRLQRIALQRLESLQRAGVQQLARSKRLVESRAIATEPIAIEPIATEPIASQPPPISKTAQSPDPIATSASKTDDSMAKKTGGTRNAEKELADLRLQVASCTRCELLACSRTQTVFGTGTTKPRLCFFGEAPGAEEDRTGEPFVGRAGQLLTDIIEKGMQLRRPDVYILNVLKCRPPDNRAPTDIEIANCREYFEQQFELLKPEFICCLGATATKALLNGNLSLGKMRGKWFDYRGARVMVTYHPSYLLRNPPAKKDTWEDIQMLMREMGLPIEKS